MHLEYKETGCEISSTWKLVLWTLDFYEWSQAKENVQQDLFQFVSSVFSTKKGSFGKVVLEIVVKKESGDAFQLPE